MTDKVEGIRICRNELQEQEGGLRACADRDDGGARLRHRVPLDRLPRHTPGGPALRRAARHDPARRAGASSTRPASQLRGEYVVGWIKRGPTGIIGTNKRDAQETVDALLEDLDAGELNEPADPSRDSLEELLAERAPEHVTYAGWEAIDRAEKAAGEPHGRPRVKLTTVDELLDAARERVR